MLECALPAAPDMQLQSATVHLPSKCPRARRQMPLNTAAANVLAQLDELQYLSFDGDLASKGFRKRLVPLLPDEREVHSRETGACRVVMYDPLMYEL